MKTNLVHFFCAIAACLFLSGFSASAIAQESEAQELNTDTNQSNIELQSSESQQTPKIYTAKDNFGGWKFGADILLGAGRCDDKLCVGNNSDWDTETTILVEKLQLQISYLWGENVFFGVMLTAFGGYPAFGGGDLRLKLLLPIGKHQRDAISMSAGFGGQIREKLQPETIFDDEYYFPRSGKNSDYPDNFYNINYMYVPIEIGYEHVFENRFILGISAQLNITFTYREYVYNSMDDGFIRIPVLDMLGAGLHLGYKF